MDKLTCGDGVGYRSTRPESDICVYKPVIVRTRFANCPSCLLDPREREIGEKYGACYKDAIEGHLQILFTDKLKMNLDEFRVMVAQVREELDNRNLKPYLGL